MLLHLGCRLMEWNMSQFLIERYEGRIAGVLSWPALVAVFPADSDEVAQCFRDIVAH
jgi:hypothetical protein